MMNPRESTIRRAGKRTFRPPFELFRRIWNRVIVVGVHDSLTNWERKRTRLVNGVSFAAILMFALFVLGYLDAAHRTTFLESLVSSMVYTVPIVLNHYRRYLAAIFVFNIYSTLVYTFFAISHGAIDGAEYLLICASVASMLFFKNFRIILFFFLLNFGCFWLCKYAFQVTRPFLFMPNGENLYVENHIVTFFVLFFLVYYFKSENTRQENLLKEQNENLAAEKQKSDDLLLNILPVETAEELKQTGHAKAKSFASVTVMFTDFRNFTAISETLAPEQLVDLIDSYFGAFDQIVSRHNIEKIKTVGDAYLCAGGLPEENDTHPVDVVSAAVEIQEFMEREKMKRMAQSEPWFDLRIGIHSGPVVAGIVGFKKFAYDIWGDTVNTAARMESSGVVGKVNISGATYALVKDRFVCSNRGRIEAKNKGTIEMYFVEREA